MVPSSVNPPRQNERLLQIQNVQKVSYPHSGEDRIPVSRSFAAILSPPGQPPRPAAFAPFVKGELGALVQLCSGRRETEIHRYLRHHFHGLSIQ